MPSDKPARPLEDIIENVQAIRSYVVGMDLTAFREDHKTYDTVERCRERISEAGAKLGDLDDIREDRLWDIVQTDLAPLCAACEDALRRLREGPTEK